jgi:hypothetical protein
MTTVLPNFSSYKSSLYHQRQKNYPELPNLFTVNYNVYSEQLVEDTWTGAEGTIL